MCISTPNMGMSRLIHTPSKPQSFKVAKSGSCNEILSSIHCWLCRKSWAKSQLGVWWSGLQAVILLKISCTINNPTQLLSQTISIHCVSLQCSFLSHCYQRAATAGVHRVVILGNLYFVWKVRMTTKFLLLTHFWWESKCRNSDIANMSFTSHGCWWTRYYIERAW